MRPWILLLVLAGMCACLAACAPATAVPGTPEAFIFACDKSNIGEIIAVEGYLRLPPTLDSTRSVMLRLYPDPSFQGKPIGVMMRFGTGPNQAQQINSSYRDEDLKVRLADGREIPFRTRVRVSGRMFVPIQPQDYDCALQDPYVEPGS